MKDFEICATGRNKSFLYADWRNNLNTLSETLHGSRILVLGAAGSIGRAVTTELARFSLRTLDVVDITENGLADLTRELRINGSLGSTTDYKSYCIDVLSDQFLTFSDSHSYDFVFNLSALKHVRLEKDDYSLTRAFKVNMLSHQRILERREILCPGGYFAVSTDKAAYPANYMGLSKRLMEFFMLESDLSHSISATVACARFANVAFSAGSLLNSWRDRFSRREPIVVPEDTYRFFISHNEAAQICIMSLLMGSGRYVTVPLDETVNQKKEMLQVAIQFLRINGAQPKLVVEGAEEFIVNNLQEYPILLTPRDTAGEKEEEIFVESGELAIPIHGAEKLGLISKHSAPAERQRAFHKLLQYVSDNTILSKRQIDDYARDIVPSFKHVDSDRNLDEKV
jgi:FlaA1/EpsC-like NDP-sugar epimerase